MASRALPSQVQRFWDSLRDALVQEGVLTSAEAKKAELEISSDPTLRDTARHFAAAENAGRGPVLIHRSALRLPRKKLIAILAHEMGHVIDKSAFNSLLARTLRGDTDEQPSDEEQRADWLANKHLSAKIRYDDQWIQTLGPGSRRPKDLR